ncbi:MAG: hypothetical protein EBZ77_14405 [Chitinophagia bacterium]|nr:hypothetical protein [Chitinophagia bacterium]
MQKRGYPSGYMHENRFVHKWYIGCDDVFADANKIREKLDNTLCVLNDDYAVERTSALKDVLVEVLPGNTFISYLKAIGKYGAMNKFPRVLKGKQMADWEQYLKQQKVNR